MIGEKTLPLIINPKGEVKDVILDDQGGDEKGNELIFAKGIYEKKGENPLLEQTNSFSESLIEMVDSYEKLGKQERTLRYLGYVKSLIRELIDSVEKSGQINFGFFQKTLDTLRDKIKEVSVFSKGKNQSYLNTLKSLEDLLFVIILDVSKSFKKESFSFVEQSLSKMGKTISEQEARVQKAIDERTKQYLSSKISLGDKTTGGGSTGISLDSLLG